MNDGGATRAEQKLMGAVEALRIDFRDKVVLDVGSSTGGFTALALRRGAAKVVAVEKGTRQMRVDLAVDARVELHEKTDIFEFELHERPDVILADVSFVSLKKVLAYAKAHLMGEGTEFLVLFKPQFEVDGKALRKGVIKSSRVRREVILEFEKWLRVNEFVVLGKRDSEVMGRFGNQERFYHLKII